MTLAIRRARASAAVAILAVSAARCASPGIPPGGPEDNVPPQVLRISPESGATNVRAREIELEFDEVVAEVPSAAGASGGGGAGGGGGFGGGGGGFGGGASGPSLGSIVLVSPRAGALRVDWRRDRVVIRPRGGFRDTTTYTVTMLPGLADLRQNVRDTAIVAVFSTGPRLATGRVAGIVFDWVAGRPAAGALAELIAADSTTYLAVADSVGRFVVPNVPPGTYALRGVLDANGNRALDPREAFAAVPVGPQQFTLGDSSRLELLAFVHDTLGPTPTTVAVADSVTLRVTFDKPLDPTQSLDPARFRVLATRDSAVTLARAVYTRAAYDSLQAARQRAAQDSAAARDTTRRATPTPTPTPPRTDTAGARRDTTRGRREEPPPVPSRPSPPTEIVVVLAEPLRPNTLYRLVVSNQRSVSGVELLTAGRGFTSPRPAPPPAARDSTPRESTPRDTTPRDTTRRTPAEPAVRRPR